jgi:DNA-binding NarL/FixJ family response regulator
MEDVIKVVICEDHALFMKGVQYSLSHKSNISFIGEAENGWKLLQLLKHVTPDVILLDINMPVMDGKAALLQIRKNYPDIKVIMLTMHDEPSTIVDMMRIGANAYLVKNCGEQKIYDAIVSCHKTGKYLDDMTSGVLLNQVQGKIPEIEEKLMTQSIVHNTQSEVSESKTTFEIDMKKIGTYILFTVAVGIIIIMILYFVKASRSLNFLENFNMQ